MKQFEGYRAVYRCVNCKTKLSNDECMYSGGVCPHCGNVARGTVCETEKSSEMILEDTLHLRALPAVVTQGDSRPAASRPSPTTFQAMVLWSAICAVFLGVVVAAVSLRFENQVLKEQLGMCRKP